MVNPNRSAWDQSSIDVLGGVSGGIISGLMVGGAPELLVIVTTVGLIGLMSILRYALDEWTDRIAAFLHRYTNPILIRFGKKNQNDNPQFIYAE